MCVRPRRPSSFAVKGHANMGVVSAGVPKSLSVMIHYCQEGFVVIEITGKSPSIRKYSKSEALAEDFESFLIQGLRPVISIARKSK